MDKLDDLDEEKMARHPLRRYNPHKHWRKCKFYLLASSFPVARESNYESTKPCC